MSGCSRTRVLLYWQDRHQAAVTSTRRGPSCWSPDIEKGTLFFGVLLGKGSVAVIITMMAKSSSPLMIGCLGRICCQDQIRRGMRMRPERGMISSLALSCWVRTHSSHAAVAYIGKARAGLTILSQGPGLGSNFALLGTRLMSKKGLAKPSPMRVKISRLLRLGWLRATPNAGPISGAVHGVAMIVARIPVRKDRFRPD